MSVYCNVVMSVFVCLPFPMAVCHCLVTWNNYVATIPSQFWVTIAVSKHQCYNILSNAHYLPNSIIMAKGNPYSLYPFVTGFYIGDINAYKQPNQKKSVAIQLSVVALEGVLVDPSSTERRQTLKFAPCMPLCFCLPSNFVNCCRCSKGNGPDPMWPVATRMQSKTLYVNLIYWIERSCSFRLVLDPFFWRQVHSSGLRFGPWSTVS